MICAPHVAHDPGQIQSGLWEVLIIFISTRPLQVFVDYTVDILSETLFLAQLAGAATVLLVSVAAPFVVVVPWLWFCFIIPVNVVGLVLLAYLTGHPGFYWKNAMEQHAPKVNLLFMHRDGSYRRFGYWINFLYQVQYALMYVWVREQGGVERGEQINAGLAQYPELLMLGFVPWTLAVVHLVCILVAMGRAFVE